MNVAMFGMNDPAQTLLQLERYVADGRMEMSEVMAIQFTDMFLSQKNRDADAQIMLVKGLRILCDVFLVRNKAKRGISTVKILHRERKKLIRMLTKGAPQLLAKMTSEAEDYRRAAKLYAHAGKKGAAMKAFAQCEKKSPGHVAAALEACQMIPGQKKLVQRLVSVVADSGPVIMYEGIFYLQPIHSPMAQTDEIIAAFHSAMEKQIGPTGACKEQIERINGERQAIERGEAAANARLQAAMDLLKPQHDYYEY
jgi:hypothetical protein